MVWGVGADANTDDTQLYISKPGWAGEIVVVLTEARKGVEFLEAQFQSLGVTHSATRHLWKLLGLPRWQLPFHPICSGIVADVKTGIHLRWRDIEKSPF